MTVIVEFDGRSHEEGAPVVGFVGASFCFPGEVEFVGDGASNTGEIVVQGWARVSDEERINIPCEHIIVEHYPKEASVPSAKLKYTAPIEQRQLTTNSPPRYPPT